MSTISKIKVGGTIYDIVSTLDAYPVGSIYLSVNATSPAKLFGGTWEQLKDRFLLAAGSAYAAGSTGGEAGHTLTVNEMPSHNHKIRLFASDLGIGTTLEDAEQGKALCAPRAVTYSLASDENNEQVAGSTGSGAVHNNMPPYLAVYMWKRVA